MRNFKRSKGFTLIEMIIVIIILGIIAATGANFLQQGLTTYFTNQDITNINSQARLALESMARRIREIRSSTDITTATSTQLTFTDVNNNSVSYQLSGTNLLLNATTLMSGLSSGSSSFTYLDQNAVATTTIANICYVVITLVVSQNNVNYTLRTVVYPRNIL